MTCLVENNVKTRPNGGIHFVSFNTDKDVNFGNKLDCVARDNDI